MTDFRLAGGRSLIGFHRLVSSDAGIDQGRGQVSELHALSLERAARSAQIITFPQPAGGERTRRQPLFCEICRFPSMRRQTA